MKKSYRFILVEIVMLLLLIIPIYVQADDTIFGETNIHATSNIPNGGEITDPITNPNAYNPGNVSGTSKVVEIGNKVIGAINVIGIIVSVAALAIIGIRYMIGSVDERAEYKQTMGPYIIGAILVFATTTIVNIIYQFASNL